MAVTAINPKSSLRLTFEVGQDEKGNPIYRSRSYANVKPTATADQVFALAGIIANLQNYPVAKISRGDQADLQNML